MSGSLLTAKAKAGGIHFLLSAMVVAGVLGLATWLWYPSGLRLAAGLFNLALIMVLVDLVLGPALTMLVYRPAKPSLRFDLAVIALIQLAALVYGVNSIHQARPAYVAFVVDRFEMVSAADLEPASLAQAQAPYNRMPDRGPTWVRVEMPTDPALLADLTLAEAVSGAGPAMLPRLYRPLEKLPAADMSRAKPVRELEQFNQSARVEQVIADLKRSAEGLRYVPMRAIGRDMTVIVDAQDGQVLGIVDLRPWS
ncbi:MAG: TfpX/TfpZ family type IV pilin accessory protein [Burkholderiaceae bacterium]